MSKNHGYTSFSKTWSQSYLTTDPNHRGESFFFITSEKDPESHVFNHALQTAQPPDTIGCFRYFAVSLEAIANSSLEKTVQVSMATGEKNKTFHTEELKNSTLQLLFSLEIQV